MNRANCCRRLSTTPNWNNDSIWRIPGGGGGGGGVIINKETVIL